MDLLVVVQYLVEINIIHTYINTYLFAQNDMIYKTVHKQVQSKTYKAQGALTLPPQQQTQFKTVSKTFNKTSKINLRK